MIEGRVLKLINGNSSIGSEISHVKYHDSEDQIVKYRSGMFRFRGSFLGHKAGSFLMSASWIRDQTGHSARFKPPNQNRRANRLGANSSA